MVWLNNMCFNEPIPKGALTGGSMCMCPKCIEKRNSKINKGKNMNTSKWDLRFLELATLVASWSKDPSTKCGAVITSGNRIISLGFNGFPAKCSDHHNIYADREVKLDRVIHAEINAILFSRQPLQGCTIYTQPFPPCARCAATIIQVGITRVVAPEPSPELAQRWGDSLSRAYEMYREAKVELNCPIITRN